MSWARSSKLPNHSLQWRKDPIVVVKREEGSKNKTTRRTKLRKLTDSRKRAKTLADNRKSHHPIETFLKCPVSVKQFPAILTYIIVVASFNFTVPTPHSAGNRTQFWFHSFPSPFLPWNALNVVTWWRGTLNSVITGVSVSPCLRR